MVTDSMNMNGYYHVVCTDSQGNVKWEDDIENLITTVGKNATLDSILGNAGAGVVLMGLKGVGTAVVADTMASHATWAEITAIAARVAPVFAVAAAGAKTTSTPTSFTMTGSATVAGCFIVLGGTTVPGNTTGILFSAGDFASTRAVVATDILLVTYTVTIT
jgi:hypothetical protein